MESKVPTPPCNMLQSDMFFWLYSKGFDQAPTLLWWQFPCFAVLFVTTINVWAKAYILLGIWGKIYLTCTLRRILKIWYYEQYQGNVGFARGYRKNAVENIHTSRVISNICSQDNKKHHKKNVYNAMAYRRFGTRMLLYPINEAGFVRIRFGIFVEGTRGM